MFKEIKKWLIQWFVIVLVLAVSGISYAAFSNILTASDGEQLTSWKWNEIVNRLNSIDEKQLPTAWVTFNGAVSSPTVLEWYNVSSVTRLSTGQYRIFFTTPMDTNEYSVSITSAVLAPGITTAQAGSTWPDASHSYSTSLDSLYIATSGNNTSNHRDKAKISIQIFGWKN